MLPLILFLSLSHISVHACAVQDACCCCEDTQPQKPACCSDEAEAPQPEQDADSNGDCCIIVELETDPVTATSPTIHVDVPVAPTTLDIDFTAPDQGRIVPVPATAASPPGTPRLHLVNCQFNL